MDRIKFPFSQRLELFPISAGVEQKQSSLELTIAGLNLAALAEEYGTPLYLYDRATMDANVLRYRQALNKAYPAGSGLTYAGKAYLCLGIAQWSRQQGLWLDCTGAGELSIAAKAGVPPENLLVHGVNKSTGDLQAAVIQAGVIVVDNLTELDQLAAMHRQHPAHFPDLWLRLKPGLAVATHGYTQTGQPDSKFGLSPIEFMTAVQHCQQEGLPLTGLHFHQGSHFHDPTPVGPAIETALDLIEETRSSLGWMPQTFCPGGGWGVPYHEDDLPHHPLEEYITFIASALIEGCQQRNLPLPRLHLEPGRSLVAQAGVAIYHVDGLKTTPQRRWLLLDGGLADNPRPALYGARYSALPVSGLERATAGPTWLAGPYCESGDVMIEALPMPEVQVGEFIAIPVSGAYQLSMGSNYNGARLPAVLWLEEGRPRLLQRRETLEELVRRDFSLD